MGCEVGITLGGVGLLTLEFDKARIETVFLPVALSIRRIEKPRQFGIKFFPQPHDHDTCVVAQRNCL